jgi:hypothetical protein
LSTTTRGRALRSTVPRRLVLATAILAALALALVPASSGAGYLSPPFDFAHRASPHDPIDSFAGGLTDRPMLVVYVRWDDVDFPPAFPVSRVASEFR